MITIKAEDGKKYGIAAAKKSKRSVLGQREFDTVGIEVDINSIPDRVKETLFLSALEAKLQAAVKKLDPEKCTKEDAQKAMKEALEVLKTGKPAKRKTPVKNLIKAEAKKMLKAQFREMNFGDEEVDASALTELVNDMFKTHEVWSKDKEGNAELEDEAQMVEDALKAAQVRIEQQEKLGNKLGKLLADRAAATPSAKTERPTPTQRVKAEKAKPKKAAPSA